MKAESHPLRVEGLHVHYGKREVLRGLSLSVRRGQIYGLLGPNGAGKTTLIRTICGRIRPSSGRVSIAGVSGKASMRHIGLVPQELALYTHLTARENLEVFGRLSGLSASETEEAIAWAGAATDITQRLNDRVDILSGGWKRRVNIAAAILHRPALLILDEPTVGVDVDARNGLHDVIVSLSHAGMGVLLTTHDLDQAETLCSVVGFLRDGIVTPQGAPRDLLRHAFGEQRQVIVELRQPASQIQAQALSRAGFTSVNSGYAWIMFSSGIEQSLEDLADALARAGLETREIRFRKPGLDSLFVRLSRGREVAS
jgi:ABC-2 type transport system ATP-binding protein